MTRDGITDLARLVVDRFHVDARAFAEQALWAAGESQKPTAIPGLVLVASSSLLVIVVWIAIVAIAVRWVRAHV